jgi:hypothetical protein
VPVQLEAIQFLVRRKYPNSPEIKPAPRPPMSGDHVGGLAAFNAEQERRKSEAQKYAVELSQLPAKEFQALYNLEAKNFREEVPAKKENQENSQFFNRPSAKADFDHWSRAAHWTLEEAVALSFGKNPEIVNWASIGRWRAESSFVLQYARILDLARRAVPWQQLVDPVAPGHSSAGFGTIKLIFLRNLKMLCVRAAITLSTGSRITMSFKYRMRKYARSS